MKMYLIAGANLFGQWLSGEPIIDTFQTISVCENNCNFNINDAKLHSANWSYNVFSKENSFYLCGSWKGKDNQVVKISLPQDEDCGSSVCDLLMAGNDYNLILVNIRTYFMWIMNLEATNDIKKVNILIEAPILKENIPKRMRTEDIIIKVVATNSACLYLSAGGIIYSGLLPSHLDSSHCEGKVCDIQCGYEHFLLLTDTGKVYSWGNGRRLQLGHGNVENLDSPTEVEALSGIKIMKISAGGWHNLALSEFGDVYAWGWNDTGQLGVKEHPDVKEYGVLNKGGIKSYRIPTLVDVLDDDGKEIELNAIDIACGSRHSAIMLEDHSVWTTGFNNYGQLGFPPDTYKTVNYYKKSTECNNGYKLMCGPWCTFLINGNV